MPDYDCPHYKVFGVMRCFRNGTTACNIYFSGHSPPSAVFRI